MKPASILVAVSLLATQAAAGCSHSKPCKDVHLYREEHCHGNSGHMCESIPANQCCGTDAEAFDSCNNSGGEYTVGGAPKGNDHTKLCAAIIGAAKGCFSVSTNTIVGCFWTSKAPIRRNVMHGTGALDASSCSKPSHAFLISDDKKYMIELGKPSLLTMLAMQITDQITDTAKYETYQKIAHGPERDAFIIQNADKVKVL